MFLKCTRRNKDGKTHHYWSVVESRRLSTGRITQRQVLYLGEINPFYYTHLLRTNTVMVPLLR